MSWSRNVSLERIEKLKLSAPVDEINVQQFDQKLFETSRSILALGDGSETSVFHVPFRSAIIVDAVHVYVQLIDYHNFLLEKDRETESSHRRALQLLHLHYSASDRIVAAYDGQRVDYHGPRLHAVILSPAGGQNERSRVVRAVAMATAIKETIERAGGEFAAGALKTRVRIGIDTGLAIAINSGRGNEPEPLFLGNPANYAAKLANGDQPGIFMSDRVRAVLGKPQVQNLETILELDHSERSGILAEAAGNVSVAEGIRGYSRRVDAALQNLREDKTLLNSITTPAVFAFHHHEPPLKSIDYSKLSPGNSIRMPLASVFADLDGFTDYVHWSIANGQVRQLVSNLHVIRGEMAAVLRDDFLGRKVRFIGDCIHGLIAAGDRFSTDEVLTIDSAVLCSGGLRSSFDLCRTTLPQAGRLGLAIGIDFGPTPITRLGIRGDRSVRCASSRAVSGSEDLQTKCGGTETHLAADALKCSSARVRRLFQDGPVDSLDYLAAKTMILEAPTKLTASFSTPSITSPKEFRPHCH